MGLDEEYIDEYWSAFRKHVHTLLAWGYADSRNRVQDTHDEPAITGFIAEAIQDRLDAVDSPSWCDQIVIKDDPPIPGSGRTGRRRWRPDLIFESVERRPRPKYHFEAKRLRKQQNIKDYLGGEGLECFLSGKYARESNEGGMLGYVQCDDISTWVERLQLAIDQDSQSMNELLLLIPQCNIHIIDAFPHEWLSKHNRNTGKSIVIHHLLLDYCNGINKTSAILPGGIKEELEWDKIVSQPHVQKRLRELGQQALVENAAGETEEGDFGGK